jgi:benzoyl-CoA reductase subunit D
MSVTAGVDVGSSAVKAVVMRVGEGNDEVLAHALARVRRRDVAQVVEEAFAAAVGQAGVDALDYVATTGEGEEAPFATGHFYGMTTHARGALFLEPRTRAVLDIGALHARAVAMDERGKVLAYKMTSQCASGSGQFLENIARYLGVSQADIGALSLTSEKPEAVSSICAVLAETDVINMVSRGLAAPDILRAMSLLARSGGITVEFTFTGGVAKNPAAVAALGGLVEENYGKRRNNNSADSIYTGALGAAHFALRGAAA